MSYALILGGLGIGLVYVGLTWMPGGVLLIWLGLSFLLVAAGYAGIGPRTLGKRQDGTLQPLIGTVLLPYRLLLEGLWQLQRRLSKEPAAHEILPGLWLGRRPVRQDLPAGVALLVDLTVEFPRAVCGTAGCDYLALPCLDAAAPEWVPFRAAVREIAAHPGPVYVHCALGHGRSATVVAAVLIARGQAADPAEAEERVRSIRAGVGLNAGQRAMLRRFCSDGSDVG